MSCSSPAHCVAGGINTLLETRDGGATWTNVRPHGAAWVVVSLACPTSTLCVAGVDAPEGKVLFVRSVDGGRQWTKVDTQSALSLDALSCPTATLCVASGGRLDGIGFAFLSVADHAGLARFPGYRHPRRAAAVEQGGDGAVVLVSRDGGLHWTDAIVPPTATELDSVSCPARRSAMRRAPTSPRRCCCAARRTAPRGATSAHPVAPRASRARGARRAAAGSTGPSRSARPCSRRDGREARRTARARRASSRCARRGVRGPRCRRARGPGPRRRDLADMDRRHELRAFHAVRRQRRGPSLFDCYAISITSTGLAAVRTTTDGGAS